MRLRSGAGETSAVMARWLRQVHTDVSARLAVADDGVGAIARSAEAAAMPGVAFAGGLWSTSEEVSASVATNPVSQGLDRFQAALRQGPALVALRSGYPVVITDFGVDHRWPALAQRALKLGVRGVICHPLRLSGEHTATLTLYAGEHGFTRSDVTCPSLFAAVAEIALRRGPAPADTGPQGEITRGRTDPTTLGSCPVVVRLHSDNDLNTDLLNVVELSGDIDMATAPEVRAELWRLPLRRTVLDLSGVGFISVGGLELLLEAHRRFRAHGARLHVVAPSTPVRRLITIATSTPGVSPGLTAEFREWADIAPIG